MVTKECVLEALNSEPIRYCGEIMEIKQGGVEFYSDAKGNIGANRFVQYRFHEIPAYEIVSQDPSFIEECISCIRQKSLGQFHLYLPSNRQIILDGFTSYRIEKTGSFADYILPETYRWDKPLPHKEIIELTANEQPVTVDFRYEEVLNGRPAFQTLYEAIVLENKLPGGKIYAFIQNGSIIGYLSCYVFQGNLYDVDHIYVLPAYRRQGIGVALAKHYINAILAAGGIPRYGNAENKGSRATAEKAGFCVVKSQDKYVFTLNS